MQTKKAAIRKLATTAAPNIAPLPDSDHKLAALMQYAAIPRDEHGQFTVSIPLHLWDAEWTLLARQAAKEGSSIGEVVSCLLKGDYEEYNGGVLNESFEPAKSVAQNLKEFFEETPKAA